MALRGFDIVTKLQNGLYGFKHATILDKVKVLLDECIETFYFVEVLLPDKLGSEHSVGHLLCVARSPQLLQELDDLRVVVGCDLCTVLSTLATLIVGDDGSKSEDKALGQLALALEVSLHAGRS